MTTRLLICATILLAGPLVVATEALAQAKKAEPDTIAQQARKVYHEGISQWRLRNYQQAGDLFSQVIRRFASNEEVPGAQLYLANCLLGQQQDGEFLQQIDQVIRNYAGTEISLLGSMVKLSYHLGKNDSDAFFDTWREAIGGGGSQPALHYLLAPGDFSYYHTNVTGLRQHFMRDFRDPIIKLCDKPPLAEQALTVFAGTFRQTPEKLPPRWFWVHVYLLLVAEKNDEAEQTFRKYADWWGDDLRGGELWWEYAEYLRTRRKDVPAARKLYETMLTKFDGADIAADAGARIADILSADDSTVKEFFDFAEPFVKRYRLTDGAKRIESMMLRKATDLAPSDKAMADRAFRMLTANLDKMPAHNRIGQYDSLIRLAMAVKDQEKAKGYFTELIGDDMWSSAAYSRAVTLSRTFKEFAPLVDACKRRRQLFDAAPAKPEGEPDAAMQQAIEAAKQLEQLKTRLKDDQIRFAEEIADEMFAKFTDTAATVEAVSLMVDYYFKQELVEPRDKWMERAINTWEYHPTTEEILNRRCISDRAAAEYDKLTRNVELAIKRFPSSQHRSGWGNMRQLCYETAKDAAGRYAWISSELDWTASGGNNYHIQLTVQAIPVPEGQDRTEAMAQGYLAWAKRLDGTNVGVWCVSQAYEAYLRNRMYDKARPLAVTLRTQKTNPGIAWRYQFNDIELMLQEGKMAEAVAAAIQRLPSEPRPQFRVNRQLSMSQLGQAFGKLNRLGEAKALSERLSKLYMFADDTDTADLLLAQALIASEDPRSGAAAAETMVRVAQGLRPTDLGFSLFMSAAYQVRGTARYEAIINGAMKAMPRAHHLLPRMLRDLGQHYISTQNRAVNQVLTQMRSTYPASTARDELDAAVERARQRSRN